jgi:hypothetical protein
VNAPITTGFGAFTVTILLPWFLIPAVIAAVVFGVWGIKKKEKIGWFFGWNLLPLLIVWPIVSLSFTLWWTKEEYLGVLQGAFWPYLILAVAAIALASKAGFLSLAVQSVIFIYALGENFLCSMAISGTWL